MSVPQGFREGSRQVQLGFRLQGSMRVLLWVWFRVSVEVYEVLLGFSCLRHNILCLRSNGSPIFGVLAFTDCCRGQAPMFPTSCK